MTTAAVLAPQADVGAHLQVCNSLLLDWSRNVKPAVDHVVETFEDRDPTAAGQVGDLLATKEPADALGSTGRLLKQLLTLPAPVTDDQGVPGAVIKESARQPTTDAADTADTATVSGLLPAYRTPTLQWVAQAPARAFWIASGWLAELIRWVLLAVILSFITYVVSEPNWIGTPSQILALFGWAFVIDVSVQAVTAALGNTADATPPTLVAGTPGGGQ